MMDKPAVGRIEFGPSATDGRDEERVDVVLGGAADVVALRARIAELEQALAQERARAQALERVRIRAANLRDLLIGRTEPLHPVSFAVELNALNDVLQEFYALATLNGGGGAQKGADENAG